MKRTELKRRPWRRSIPGDRALREAFRYEVLLRGGFECAVTTGRCAGPLQAHHVLPKEHIIKLARSEKWTSTRLAASLWNPDNGLAVCERHHDLHTRAIKRIPHSALADEALLFAIDLGLEHRIDRDYPTDERSTKC